MPFTAAAAAVDTCIECFERRELEVAGRCRFCRRWDRTKARPLAPEPTWHPPGSAEKVECMRRRVECGYACLHPLDATDDCQPDFYREPSRCQARVG
jgi:hypothetical protein